MTGSKNVYASVKSYSKRGKLLKKSDFQILAESRDLDEFMTRIKNTIYGDSVSDVQKPYTSQGIESVLRSHLADTHYSIAKTSGNSDVLEAYYMKFIVSNLKLILKGKALGKSQEEIQTHINLHAEELIKQRDIVIKALITKDLEEAVTILNSTEFGEAIAKAATIYNDTKNIQIFDTYFDKILIQRLASAIKKYADKDSTKLVGMDIDFYNILSVIRGKFWGLQEEEIEDLIVSQTPTAKDLLGRMIGAATIHIAFKINNPNPVSIIVQVMAYQLFETGYSDKEQISGGEIGSRPQGMIEFGSNYYTLLPNNSILLKENIVLKNTGNTPELWSTLENNTAKWRVTGDVFYNLSSITSGQENELHFDYTK